MSALAFVSSTPLLVEPFDQSATPELVELRAATRRVVRDLVCTAQGVVVAASSSDAVDLDASAGGTLRPWGVDVVVGGRGPKLELGHLVGAWLLDDAGWTGPRRYVGPALTDEMPETTLVVGDGSICRTERAPGAWDPRAEAFDATIVAALRQGRPSALRRIDDDLAVALGCCSGPLLRSIGQHLEDAAVVSARCDAEGAPLGVGWWAAFWSVSHG